MRQMRTKIVCAPSPSWSDILMRPFRTTSSKSSSGNLSGSCQWVMRTTQTKEAVSVAASLAGLIMKSSTEASETRASRVSSRSNSFSLITLTTKVTKRMFRATSLFARKWYSWSKSSTKRCSRIELSYSVMSLPPSYWTSPKIRCNRSQGVRPT